MLSLGNATQRNCQGVTRRHVLQAGGLGLLGLTLADWWGLREAHAAPSGGGRKREASCIVIFLSGGPSHFETFDPKPGAPVNIRGPYGTIPTNVPSIQISELLPQIAQHLDKCAIIRSMTSKDGGHSGVFMGSGGSKFAASYGAVLTKLKGRPESGMPPFVHVGPSGYLPAAGSLGSAYNPIRVADPSGKQVQLPQFALSTDISADRFGNRRELLGAVDK